ncbi:radical SAM family heme chaperone HemW [Buchnera aphidicola]|uniref:radical SAM family heme chaperone HemW n=1 Tax=Buchnera aphidicola TaxID=9 RepID=UPI00346485A7
MFFVPPLSLYIHIPWCIKKCSYCDFNTYKFKKKISEQIQYIKMLIQDLKNDVKLVHQKHIQTIFIGGGTPNLINHHLLRYLICKIKKIIPIKKGSEITIEINPDYITIKDILKYIKIGINRISIGIQSFQNQFLNILGRTHSKNQIITLLYQIKKNNNINFNIDLMYGLPLQSTQDCILDLKTAIKIQPNHISWYQLNIEKNTIFYYQKPKLPTENTIWNMYHNGDKLLKKNHYCRYEISSYSKKNFFCAHNLNYWNFGDYIGIGCGSHGKITNINGQIIRTIKKKRIYEYCNQQYKYIEKKNIIKNSEKPVEYFMNVLRLLKPIKKKSFCLHTNLNLSYIKKSIEKAIKKKYIIEKKKYWFISEKGQNLLNNLIECFIM